MTAEGLSDMEACALAANLRAAVATTSEACFFEAAIHAILSGDITSFTRAQPHVSWEDHGWALLKCAGAHVTDDLSVTMGSSHGEQIRPEESVLQELVALRGTAFQMLCARLAVHGVVAIMNFLLDSNQCGTGDHAVICRVKAMLACVWRRVAREETAKAEYSKQCDKCLANYALQLSACPATIKFAAYYATSLGLSLIHI